MYELPYCAKAARLKESGDQAVTETTPKKHRLTGKPAQLVTTARFTNLVFCYLSVGEGMKEMRVLNRTFEAEIGNGTSLRSKVGVSGAVAPLQRKAGEVCKAGVVAFPVKIGAMTQHSERPQTVLASPQITSHSSGRGVGWWPAKPGWFRTRAA